ncbi:MAG: transcription repressor NadR [Gemmiger sp.]
MNAAERREAILNEIAASRKPVSGAALAGRFGVSRQIIVQDIAALREDNDIISTHTGYLLASRPTRVFKVVHSDEEIEDELTTIVQEGGTVKDVFVWHKIYGRIEGPLNIATPADVADYMDALRTGRSRPLKKVTCEYHYHTVEARSEEILDRVQAALDARGYLVKNPDN